MTDAQKQIDDLLDADLNDLADLPESKPFPPGAYQVSLEFASKEINKKPAVEMKMKLVQVLEFAEGAEPEKPLEPGKAESNMLYILKNNDGTANEIAQGQLKKIMQVLQPVVGGSSTREIMTAAKGTVVTVILKTKEDKEKVLRQQVHEMLVQ